LLRSLTTGYGTFLTLSDVGSDVCFWK